MYKVLIKKVGEDICEKTLENNYKEVQEILNGYFEYIHVIDEFYLAVDENGLLKNLEECITVNGVTYVGTVIVFRMGKMGGWKSLTKKEILTLKQLLTV